MWNGCGIVDKKLPEFIVSHETSVAAYTYMFLASTGTWEQKVWIIFQICIESFMYCSSGEHIMCRNCSEYRQANSEEHGSMRYIILEKYIFIYANKKNKDPFAVTFFLMKFQQPISN